MGYTVKLVDESYFFQISALLGLLLGIFQFLLQRHEDKILAKINMTGNRIEQIINQEITFDQFYNSIPNVEPRKNFKRWINKNIDPKLQMKEFFIFLLEDHESRKFFFNHIDKTPISINLSYQNSEQKFEMLDIIAKTNTANKKNLHDAYRSFFIEDEKINKIIEKINQQINIKEFRLIVLSNINIISEIIPQFTSNNLKNFVEELYIEDNESIYKSINFESSKEYRQYLHNKVLIKLMRTILS